MPVLRLKQNKGLKIVLQVLLGAIAACSAIAYSIMSTKEVLRQSPCSIAGQMELLARSELRAAVNHHLIEIHPMLAFQASDRSSGTIYSPVDLLLMDLL